jgi:hypothetical protein
VRVRCTGLRDVGTPGDDVVGVVPVGRSRPCPWSAMPPARVTCHCSAGCV